MKRYIPVAAWIALSMLTFGPSFATADSPAAPPAGNGQQGQEAQTNTGVAQTPASVLSWQQREMARYANQKRAEERRQQELSKAAAPQLPPDEAATTNSQKSDSGKKRQGKMTK